MPAEPFSAYADLLSSCIRASEGRARSSKDAEGFEALVEDAAYKYESGSAALSESTWTNRALWEHELAERWRSSYSALDQMAGLAHATLRLLADGFADGETSPPDIVRYAVSVLLTRAISTTHEICALLRAGFPRGAMARWRTLYEVSVISGVLEIGNRGTAARYVNHRWVLAAKHEASELETAGLPPGQFSQADIEQKAKEYVRRYGPEYRGTYGWAAEVTRRKLNVAKPRFDDLERLVGEYKKHRRGYANRAVHADSVGNLLMVSGDGLLHPGAWLDGVEEVAMPTVICLRNVVDALLGVWCRDPTSSTRVAVIRALSTDVAVTLRIQAGLSPPAGNGGLA